MKKKLLSLALVLAMALTLMPTMAFAADGDDATVKISTSIAAKDAQTAGTATVTVAIEVTDGNVTTGATVGAALSSLKVELFKDGGTTAVDTKTATDASALTASNTYDFTLSASGTYTAKVTAEYNTGYAAAADTSLETASGYTYTAPSQDVALTASDFSVTMASADATNLTVSFKVAGSTIAANATPVASATADIGTVTNQTITLGSPTIANNEATYTGTISASAAIKALEGEQTVTLKLTAGTGFTAPQTNPTCKFTVPSGGSGDTKTALTLSAITASQVSGQAKVKLSFTVTATDLAEADLGAVTAAIGTGDPVTISSGTFANNTLTVTDAEIAVPDTVATGNVTVTVNVAVSANNAKFTAPEAKTATVSYTKPGDEGKTPLALTAANFANGTLTITMTSEEFAKAGLFSVTFEPTSGTPTTLNVQPSAFTAGATGTYTYTIPTSGYPTAAGTYTIKVTAVPTDTATYTNSSTVSAGTYTVSAADIPAQPVRTTYDYKSGKVTWQMPSGSAAGTRFFIVIYKANAVDYSGHGVAYTEAYITDYDHDGCVQVTKDGGVYSATFKPKLSNGDYVLVVENFDVGSMDGVKQLAFTISGGNSTTSVVIPSAGSVKTEADVTAAVNELASMPETALTQAVVGNTAKANAYEDLDAKAKEIKGITVNVVSASAPDFIKDKASRIEVVGAALNASGTTVTLTFGTVSNSALTLPSGGSWDTSSAVKFSATPTNVASSSNLKTPIVITLPRPENMIAKNIVVLHYTSKTAFERIYPKVTSTTVTFAVTGFSNFAIVEDTNIDNNDYNGSKNPGSGSSSGSSRPTNGGGSISGVTGITVIPNTPGTSSGIFTDVPSSHTFATQITWARDNNVMGGYSDGSFRPNANTNRQQLWMVLGRLAGSNPADMAAARTWAINAGISDGTNAQGAMSRQQLVTMLYRFAQSQGKTLTGSADLSSYPDSGAVASYAQEALAWAVGNGIVTGTSDGKLNPEGTASRAHFAVFLYRFSHMS